MQCAVVALLRPHERPAQVATAALISAAVGNRPLLAFEQASLPSTRMSKTPPPDLFKVTSACGRLARIVERASRATDS